MGAHWQRQVGQAGSSVTEWWMASGAEESGTWPWPAAGQERVCRRQFLGQATTSPSSMPLIVIPAGLRRQEPLSGHTDCPGQRATRSTGGAPWLRRPACILVRRVATKEVTG
jgi:hypothetical protein